MTPRRGSSISLALILLALAGTPSCANDPGEPSRIFQVTQVQPNTGPADSIMAARIMGRGFVSGATVTVDGAQISATVASSTQINVTIPPHAAGSVDVVVTNPDGATAGLRGGYTHVPLAVTSLFPASGFAGTSISIVGSGISSGASVTFGGVAAAVRTNNGTTIVVTAPLLVEGPVDVVVTNPGGSVATLAGAFTYEVITLTAAPASVAAGGQLTITWSRGGVGFDDWIGLFRVGDSNEDYGWWAYVPSATQSTLNVPAPLVPGQYEFRYLPNDGYVDVARSNAVTVLESGAAVPASTITFPRRKRR